MMRSMMSILAAAAATWGCHDFEIATPDGFVELDATSYAYQAADAEGVVLAVREFSSHDANREFWERAVSAQMQRLGSYRLLDEREVASADGTAGKLMTFERSGPGERQLYAVAVFVKDDPLLFVDRSRVFVVESGGSAEPYEHQQPALAATLSTLDLDLLW